VVKDADWVRKTGNSVLDKAVDRAMKTVRTVPAFPEGASDSERTFNINIGFEAKRVSA
jgi:outer membrane biosynthesis protein TonB